MNPDTDTDIYSLERGDAPLIVSIPHAGTVLPGDTLERFAPAAHELRDTDWHLGRLYGFAPSLGATVLRAKVSRYVIDLNRPETDESLYPGRTTTGLCPTETFRGEPLYLDGRAPDEAEKARRVAACWRPYHDALAAEIERLRALHGAVLLWEAHSIAGVLPRLFDGRLPDLSLGTADGAACGDAVIDAVVAVARRSPYGWVLNGRFRGGWITRRHGAPRRGVHAVQMEMVQALYMDEQPPFDYRTELADRVAPWLRAMMEAGLAGLPVVR